MSSDRKNRPDAIGCGNPPALRSPLPRAPFGGSGFARGLALGVALGGLALIDSGFAQDSAPAPAAPAAPAPVEASPSVAAAPAPAAPRPEARSRGRLPDPARIVEHLSSLDRDGDGALGPDEIEGVPPGLFREADADHDDKLSQAEIAAAAERIASGSMRPGRPGRPGAPEAPSAEQVMQDLDANADGAIARDEARGPLADQFEESDADHDGSVNGVELAAAVERFRRQGPPRGHGPREGGDERGPGAMPSPERVLEHLDADKSGAIEKSEAKGPFAEHFDRVDADKNGSVSVEELEAAGRAMRDRFREGIREHGDEWRERFEEMRDRMRERMGPGGPGGPGGFFGPRPGGHGHGPDRERGDAKDDLPWRRDPGYIVGRLDGDGDGSVTKDEFVGKAAEAFGMLDADGDGALTPPELAGPPPGGHPGSRHGFGGGFGHHDLGEAIRGFGRGHGPHEGPFSDSMDRLRDEFRDRVREHFGRSHGDEDRGKHGDWRERHGDWRRHGKDREERPEPGERSDVPETAPSATGEGA